MHRTHAAGLLAIALPWTFGAWWALAVPMLALLWLRSASGWAAALAGAIVYEPRLWPAPILAAPVAWWIRRRFPPGSIHKTARARLLGWIYLVRTFSWRGHGPGSVRVPLEHAHIRSDGLSLVGAPAHNEWLEVCYEWGIAAVVVCLGGLFALMLFARPHHALSASVVAAVVVLAFTSPIRALVVWLRGGKPHLFGPPLRATITVHLDFQGRAYLYVPHAAHDPDLQWRVGQALVLLGQNWIAAHQRAVNNGDVTPSAGRAIGMSR